MRIGIVAAPGPEVAGLAVRAEALGFDSFWVYDTPMVYGDPFVGLALCAGATRRIRLGIGVTSPALRSAPAAAAAVGSLNALAPGRIICGVGTGNTARRALGMRPTKLAELEAFAAELRDLTAGREVAHRERGRSSRVRFLHVGPYVDIAAPVEFVVAAFGPKAAAVAGRLGAGLISFGLHDPAAWSALGEARRAAAREGAREADGARRGAGREEGGADGVGSAGSASGVSGVSGATETDGADGADRGDGADGGGGAGRVGGARSYLISALHVLADGADRYGDPVRDSVGHIALGALVLGAEEPAFRAGLPPAEAAAVDRLLAMRGTTATDPRLHQALYRNYLGRPSVAERELIVPSLVDRFGLVGTRSEVVGRIEALERAGVDELLIQPVVDPERQMVEFARLLG
ncbi:LLM class flavin-dependent oxidoreductase [Streptomyces sp. HSW2009]|uniref:LLM class flavin-dependent oxidoreductase n=1 Tax=Streptomyces sp. HSW2009 TaxID=3142890 RepID=UPI0032EB585B